MNIRFDYRMWLGSGLILFGGLLLLEKFGVLHGAANLFWGAIMLLAMAYFLYIFVKSPQGRWWAIIPGMVFLGLAVNVFLPSSLSGLGGGIFLGTLGLAFLIVYFTNRARWWGIILGGVLLTLTLIASQEGKNWINTGSIFFVGLGFTFVLVAILPNPVGKMQWTYIPAAVLVTMGALLGSQTTTGLADYIWPIALILIGLVVVASFFLRKD
jgi:hypothetical protein